MEKKHTHKKNNALPVIPRAKVRGRAPEERLVGGLDELDRGNL